MNKSINNYTFTRWIFESYFVSAEGLALFRIFTGMFILFFLMPSIEMIQFIANLPQDFFVPPPGPMMLFDGFPSLNVLLIFYGLLVISLIGLLLGIYTKTASILTGLTFLIIKGFFYSVGKINHDFLIILVPLIMAYSGWGSAYSLDSKLGKKDTSTHAWALSLLALCIGFMMFTAGFPKLLGGWLNFDTQATLGHFYKQFFVNGRQDLLAPYLMGNNTDIYWEGLDYATVIFEMGFLVAIIHPSTTRLFICFSILFHLSIMMILNISFLPNFIAYAAFFNWAWLDEKIRHIGKHKFKLNSSLNYLPVLTVLLGLLVLFTGCLVFSEFDLVMLQSDLKIYEIVIVSIASFIAVGYIAQLIKKPVVIKENV